MSIFGWSYPPGVTGNEPEIVGYDGPCAVCGRGDDDCICPECPVCGSYGDPLCYEEGVLIRSQEQVDSRTEYEKREAEAAEQEAKYYAAEQASEEAAQSYWASLS